MSGWEQVCARRWAYAGKDDKMTLRQVAMAATLEAELARLRALNAELLEASQSALDWLGECFPGTAQAEIADQLRAAIAKARQ